MVLWYMLNTWQRLAQLELVYGGLALVFNNENLALL